MYSCFYIILYFTWTILNIREGFTITYFVLKGVYLQIHYTQNSPNHLSFLKCKLNHSSQNNPLSKKKIVNPDVINEIRDHANYEKNIKADISYFWVKLFIT
jgi:hypothetical protein